MAERKLAAGRYLVAPNGVVHGYSDDMAKVPGVKVLVVDDQGIEHDQGVTISQSLHDKLVKLLQKMPDDPALFSAGKPRVDWIERTLNQKVTAKQRDIAWEEAAPLSVGAQHDSE